MTDNAIHVKLSKLSRKHNVTLNAAAEIWGKTDNFSVYGSLDENDRAGLGSKSFQVIQVKKNGNTNKKKMIEFVKYPLASGLLKAHIDEINRAYTNACYTAAFILIRKVIENLVTSIIKKKFPSNSKPDKELYLDLDKGRILDLSVLIKNLKERAKGFDPDERKLVERILQKAEDFKDDANDKTHSLYHLSSKKELDDKVPQMTFDLINEFFTNY